jgi:hypothetical protein
MNIGNNKPLLYYFAIIAGVLVIIVGNDIVVPKFAKVEKAPTPTYAAPTAPLVITATPTGGVSKVPSTTLKATSSASVTAVPTKQ